MHFDVHDVVADVVERLEQLEVDELLRAERGVAVAERPAQERLVLLAQVRLHRVRHVAPAVRVLALVDQGEGHSVAERPQQQCVVIAFADADEE